MLIFVDGMSMWLDFLTCVDGTKFDFDIAIFTTYSTVPTSGIARRDPSRHVDVIIQILTKIRLM